MTTFQASAPSIKGYTYTENAFLPKVVTIPLCQEKDCICKSLVNKGDIVNEGDVIAKASGNKSNIHSPIPGEVVDIVSTICPSGRIEKAIKIKLGGKFSYLGKKLKNKTWQDLSPDSIIKKFADLGIVNTFICSSPVSLEEQIKEKLITPKRYLVVRMFDEDLLRVSDSLMAKFKLEEIKEGAKITAKALDAEAIIYAVDEQFFEKNKQEKSKPENESDENIYYVQMNSKKYPSGYESEIKNTFNKLNKKTSGITLDSNALFVDPVTMFNVYNGIVHGLPVINQYVHFSGNCLYSSCFINVKIGFSIQDIVSQLGGFAKQPNLVVINGQICGTALSAMNVPITKYVKSVEFISKTANTDYHVYSCVKCGQCRYICPVKLSPDLLYNYMVNHRNISDAHKLSSVLCTDCGLCNTVCKSRIPLSQTISVLKNRVLEENKNAGKE